MKAEVFKGKPIPKQVTALHKHWTAELKEIYPDATPGALSKAARGQITWLVDNYGLEAVQVAASFLIRNWEPLRDRWKRKGAYPSLSALHTFHETLVNDGQVWLSVQPTLEAYRAWKDKLREKPHLMGRSMPKDLKKDYAAAKPKLEAIGLA